MTDLGTAINNLKNHSICLCKDGDYFTSDKKGISPLIDLIDRNFNLTGYSAADRIIGKAAAMLFVKSGITAVHGRVMSIQAKEYLYKNDICFSFDNLTEKIINRSGNDICPMERTVKDIDDPEIAYTALKSRLAELQKGK